MKIRLYLDEDAMDGRLARALKGRGVDVVTTLEEGMLHRPDDRQLAHAVILGRATYTFNAKDYLVLHADYLTQGRHHAGIILAPQQVYSIGEQMRRLLKLVTLKSAEAMQTKLSS
ncbi:MAG: DUF5615 family PIN-like protein [Acidobacteriota bacterium]